MNLLALDLTGFRNLSGLTLYNQRGHPASGMPSTKSIFKKKLLCLDDEVVLLTLLHQKELAVE